MVTETIRVKCLKFGEQFTFPQDDLEKTDEMKKIESMIDFIRPFNDRRVDYLKSLGPLTLEYVCLHKGWRAIADHFKDDEDVKKLIPYIN